VQPLQRGAELGAERHARDVGHRSRLKLDRALRRRVGTRQDVHYRLDLGLLGPGPDLGLERCELSGESAVRIGKRLARLIQGRRQCLDLPEQFGRVVEGLGNERHAGRAGMRHAAGIACCRDGR
jgi:hypothetical protein